MTEYGSGKGSEKDGISEERGNDERYIGEERGESMCRRKKRI